MDTWTNQVGYPVVKIERNLTDYSISVKQERFYMSSLENDNLTHWCVPIQFKFKNCELPTEFYWLMPDAECEFLTDINII